MFRFKISLIEEPSTLQNSLNDLACPRRAFITRGSLIDIRVLVGPMGAEQNYGFKLTPVRDKLQHRALFLETPMASELEINPSKTHTMAVAVLVNRSIDTDVHA